MTPRTLAPGSDVDLGTPIDTFGKFVQHVRANPLESNTTYRAHGEWQGGFRSAATVRHFPPIVSDEPRELGGTDSAATPIEQLLAALANCVATAYATNAAALGIPIRGLSVDIEGDLDLQAFLGLSWGNAGYERVRVTVSIDSPSPREFLEELHCGVTRTSRVGQTFTRPVPLEIRLA